MVGRVETVDYPVRLIRGDSFKWQGQWYIVAHRVTFRKEGDEQKFLDGATKKRMLQMPGCFGGLAERVWVWSHELWRA
jgi:hypothetical protein